VSVFSNKLPIYKIDIEIIGATRTPPDL